MLGELRKYFYWIFFVMLFLIINEIFPIVGGEYIFGSTVSNDSEYQVKLTENVIYELVLVEIPFGGPEAINVSISKGFYIALDEEFRLMHPEGDYLPYRKRFTVNETGIYQIHVKPLYSGTFKIGIKQYT